MAHNPKTLVPNRTFKTAKYWLWAAFSKHALVPLLIVELLLVLVYVFSVHIVNERSTDYLRETAIDELEFSSRRYSSYLQNKLAAVETNLAIYTDALEQALQDTDYVPPTAEIARRRFNEQGVFYTWHNNNGGAATFYPAATPGARQNLEHAYRLIATESLMRSLVTHGELIEQVYFNQADSLSTIYPYFDVLEQFDHQVDVTDFSFFYLADPEHNPAQTTQWTPVYLDPAGRGWTASAVRPVYIDGKFMGVAGFDITIDELLEEVQSFELPWQGYAVLLDESSNVMAISDRGAADLGLEALPKQADKGIISEQRIQQQNYNLAAVSQYSELKAQLERDSGQLRLAVDESNFMFGWSPIETTDWTLLTVVDEQQLFASTQQLNDELKHAIYWMLAGLVLFYIVYFFYIWQRTKRLGGVLEHAVDSLSQRLGEIEQRNYDHPLRLDTPIVEFKALGERVEGMARILKKHVERLAASERRLREAMQSSGDIAIEIDRMSRDVFGSKPLFKRLGEEPPKEPVALDQVLARVHPDHKLKFLQSMDASLANGTPFDEEFQLRTSTGDYLWFHARGQGTLSTLGTRTRIVATLTDVEQRKRAELHLQQAKQDADKGNREKSLFLSSVTHELKTPLTAIVGFTQLTELGPLTEQQQLSIHQIKRASSHLLRLIDDILTHNEIEAGSLSVQASRVDLSEVVAEAKSWVMPTADEKAVSIYCTHLNCPAVVGDAQRIKQVLTNILVNAIKYNRQGGRVYVSCESDESDVHLQVRDEGHGIDADQVEAIFEPYERNGKETSNVQGNGIGLTISRDLVARMGGRIQVMSTLDHGSMFTITLPRYKEPSA